MAASADSGEGVLVEAPGAGQRGSGLRGLLRSRAAYAGLTIGIALFTAIILWEGIGDVSAAFARAGWWIAAVGLFHLPSVAADALGWRCLLPALRRPRMGAFLWGRWVGESINDLLPVLQMGGNVVKAMVLTGRGVEVGLAGASVVVDVTLVVLSQIIFTFAGLAMVWTVLGRGGPILLVPVGAAIMGLLLGGFYVAQRRGFFGIVVRATRRILGGGVWNSASAGAEAIDGAVVRLYGERRAVLSSLAWHVLSWVLGIGEIWFALRLLGQPVDFATALLFESLGQAIRTGAFAIPGGLGVQEGGYVLVGAVLGIPAPVALALSLARRVREFLLGVPGLLAWQASTIEGALRAGGAKASSAAPEAAAASGLVVRNRWRVRRSPIVQAVNLAGGGLRRIGLPIAGLEEEGLLRAARRETSLEDFGDPSFREPFRRLLASIEGEARLNPVGRLATRIDLIRLLSNRLRFEEDRKRNPGIAAEEIRGPIIITGLPRTGTTLLHNLLALDPAHRAVRTWEAMLPSPPPEAATYTSDRRIEVTESQIRWFHRLVEGFNRIHPVGARLPEECLVLTSHSFLSYQFETTHRVPSYMDWLQEQDLRPAYDLHRRLLQHLQWRCPGRWVLKAPAHMFDFEALFAVYPDARVIMTHRDPLEVAASNASLTATLWGAFSDAVDPREVGPESSGRWAEGIHRALRSRDRGCAPPERFLDLRFRDLIADPVATVRKVYTHFDLPSTEGQEERLRGYLAENPQDKHGRHRYRLEDFGLSAEGEKRRYALYRERYGY